MQYIFLPTGRDLEVMTHFARRITEVKMNAVMLI
jgi:hypothetical protein